MTAARTGAQSTGDIRAYTLAACLAVLADSIVWGLAWNSSAGGAEARARGLPGAILVGGFFGLVITLPAVAAALIGARWAGRRSRGTTFVSALVPGLAVTAVIAFALRGPNDGVPSLLLALSIPVVTALVAMAVLTPRSA